ncbi:MAG: hypothetical protein ACRDLN_05920 [Solirubrobacteraceae bacterium]
MSVPSKVELGLLTVSPEEIPAHIVRFLRQEMESVRELETLLALRASAATRTTDSLAAELRSGVRWTEQQLEGLRAKGLVRIAQDESGAPSYRYAPGTTDLAAIVDAVADLFAKRRSTVIRLIFADTDQDVLRSFADAFRIRREEED